MRAFSTPCSAVRASPKGDFPPPSSKRSSASASTQHVVHRRGTCRARSGCSGGARPPRGPRRAHFGSDRGPAAGAAHRRVGGRPRYTAGTRCGSTKARTGIAVVDGARTVPVASEWQPHESLFSGTVAGAPVTVQVQRRGTALTLRWRGCEITARARTPQGRRACRQPCQKRRRSTFRASCSRPCRGWWWLSPRPKATRYRLGQPLAIVDAMKMENVLRAARDGRIVAVHAKVGDSLAADQVIMEFAAEE